VLISTMQNYFSMHFNIIGFEDLEFILFIKVIKSYKGLGDGHLSR